jgi:hypothetical protein
LRSATLAPSVLLRKVFLMTTAPRPPAQLADEVLEEEVGGLARLDGEVLLHLLALAPAEGRIGEDDVVAVPLLDVHHVLGERVGVADAGRLDPVQDHVHDAEDVGERLLLLPVEGPALERVPFRGGEVVAAQVLPGLAEEARRAAGAVVDRLADLRIDDLDHGADERPGRVVFAAVPAGVAHALDAGLVEVGQLVLGLLLPKSSWSMISSASRRE